MPENWFLRLSLHNYSGFWNDYKTPARSSKTCFGTPVFDFWREKQVGFMKNNKNLRENPSTKNAHPLFRHFLLKKDPKWNSKKHYKNNGFEQNLHVFLTAECIKLVVKQLFKPKTCEPYPSQLLWPANYFNYYSERRTPHVYHFLLNLGFLRNQAG